MAWPPRDLRVQHIGIYMGLGVCFKFTDCESGTIRCRCGAPSDISRSSTREPGSKG